MGFAAGGSKLAYPSGLRAATVWNLTARTPECVVECEDVLVGVAIRADGRFLATGERGGRIRVRDMGGGAEWRTTFKAGSDISFRTHPTSSYRHHRVEPRCG